MPICEDFMSNIYFRRTMALDKTAVLSRVFQKGKLQQISKNQDEN